ncbi:acetamidase/formamidase family protein [Pseudofrankia sp. DC12]|uniref:acetamidase/formamidase family protein n=1 Tax=Pseudofrankia sp. DC12 TaxID=683315 RepID=UPI0005F7F02B|nr:acetamidase/formamidase family protein [Pseudofrankia sp. DC12]
MALQPGKGKVDGKHYLPSTPETVRWGELPTARTRPVLTVDNGATVTIDTVSQEGILEDQGRDPDTFFARHGVTASEVLEDARAIAASGIPHRFGVDGPHVVTGPVHVRGAEPGDVLRVEILSLLPRARYGLISNRHGQGLLAGEFPEGPMPDQDADARHWQGFRTVGSFCAVERRRGKLFGVLDATAGGARVRFPLNPFVGIMAVAVDLGGEPGSDGADPEAGAATVPSTSVGLHGGALDCGDLGLGARLYLPVQVSGALFAVGDPHYAAGAGKIGLTALEGPLRATFRLSALREPAARAALGSLREPFVETELSWLTLGLDVDPTEAIRRAARSAVLFLSSRLGLDRASALAYLTAAADFGMSQVVNGVQTAYCRIRRSDFTEPPPPRPRLPRAALGRLVGNDDGAGYDGASHDRAGYDGASHDGASHDGAGYDGLDGASRDGGGYDADGEALDGAARTQDDGDAPREDERVGLPRAAVRRKKVNDPPPPAGAGADERDGQDEAERDPAGTDGGPAAPAPRAADQVPGSLPRQVTSSSSRRPLRRSETPTPPSTG